MKKVIVLVYFLVLFNSGSFAQTQETKIQAVFVLKFIENVKWPQDKKEIVLGIVGKSDVLIELESRLKIRNPNGIIIKKISTAEAGTCDAVFVPSSEDRIINTLTNALSTKAVLVITESNYSTKGSGISFIEVDGRLHFVINKAVLEDRGLKVSSTLLTLGKQV